MAHDELWLSYHQVSRSNKPVTAQLIELEFQNQKLVDLEDVLDHLFHQGFVEARYRPVAFWENHEGQRIHGAHVVEDLLKNGTGKCSQTALHLVIADAPSAVWFSYHYLHNPSASVVTQRIKLDALRTKFELIAHLTNHIFASGYLAPNLRTKVYWQGSCGRRIDEHEHLEHLLCAGDGISESACLRLVIGRFPFVHLRNPDVLWRLADRQTGHCCHRCSGPCSPCH
ncbi:hypothetical protein EDC04DRAFT_2560768 [Pisolithus marmoratus]|nr:hypothetical protein EDC04DRAFT_2560768 [Pisolithus marmoratus]